MDPTRRRLEAERRCTSAASLDLAASCLVVSSPRHFTWALRLVLYVTSLGESVPRLSFLAAPTGLLAAPHFSKESRRAWLASTLCLEGTRRSREGSTLCIEPPPRSWSDAPHSRVSPPQGVRGASTVLDGSPRSSMPHSTVLDGSTQSSNHRRRCANPSPRPRLPRRLSLKAETLCFEVRGRDVSTAVRRRRAELLVSLPLRLRRGLRLLRLLR